jgi:hypothetical protein
VLAIALIHAGIVVRSLRWMWLLRQSGFLRKAALAAFSGALIGAAFLAALGLAGETVPSLFQCLFAPISKRFACAAGHKLRSFQDGLHAMRSLWDVAMVTAFSVCLWGLIAMAYFETTRAFIADQQLAALPFARCIPLLALSSGASFFQLPVLGWFSQIGLVAAGISAIYRVPAEVSVAWSATLLLVTLLSPAPAGLIWVQLQGISLRMVAQQASSKTNTSTCRKFLQVRASAGCALARPDHAPPRPDQWMFSTRSAILRSVPVRAGANAVVSARTGSGTFAPLPLLSAPGNSCTSAACGFSRILSTSATR